MKVDLLRGVFAYGWEKPSAIQQRAIVPIYKGRDVIVQSQSGTGKTAVFCLGALQVVEKRTRKPQVLLGLESVWVEEGRGGGSSFFPVAW